jgi:hypothetical protein
MEPGLVRARCDRYVKEKESPVKISVIMKELDDAVCQRKTARR